MGTYTFALSYFDAAFDQSGVVLIDVFAENDASAAAKLSESTGNREWLMSLVNAERDIDGITVGDFILVARDSVAALASSRVTL